MMKEWYVEDHPLIGKKLEDVEETHNFRLARKDNVHYILTMDIRPSRVNVEVDEGVITKVWMG